MVQLTGAYRKFSGPHPFEAGAKSGSLKVIAKLTLKGDNGAIVILTTGSSWVWRYLTIANDTGEGASYDREKRKHQGNEFNENVCGRTKMRRNHD